MKLRRFEERWAQVIGRALIPEDTYGGLAREPALARAFAEHCAASPWWTTATMRLALWLAWLAPLLLLGQARTLASLPGPEQEELLERLLLHPSYAVREPLALLKLVFCIVLIGNPQVQRRLGVYDLGGARAVSGFHDATHEGLGVAEADFVDFVIIGSGAGGGAAARVLAAAGCTVAVLEEGPPFSRADVGTVAARSMGRYFRASGQMAALGRAPMPVLQGRCVGGGTAINSAIVWRLPAAVLARWHEEHGLVEGLPEADLRSAYELIERELHVAPTPEAVATQSDRLMRLAAERAGIAHKPTHRSVSGCHGSGRCMHGCPHDAKQSMAVTFLRHAVEHGATVHAHARVERILTASGRAIGVAGRIDGDGPRRGERFRVAARRAVIVAASVIGSPNLLARSGLCRDSEALGAHFMAHPGTTVMGLYDQPVRMWTGASQGYEATGLRDTLGVKLETINVPPEVLASRLPGAGRRFLGFLDQLNQVAAWAIAVRMDAEGTVRPARFLGPARIHYTPTESDMRRLRGAMKKCAELHFLAGARSIVSGIFAIPEVLERPDQLHLYDEAPLDPRAYHLVATHLFGTCRAGRDPRTSVVDPTLRVHGVEGLYVMDASVFPSNTGVNPQHSIMAVAMVASRRLA